MRIGDIYIYKRHIVLYCRCYAFVTVVAAETFFYSLLANVTQVVVYNETRNECVTHTHTHRARARARTSERDERRK